MFSFLLSLINPLGKIAESIVVAKTKALDAKTEQDRIEAEVAVNQLEARQAVLIAEQGSWLTGWIRPLFALPFIIYNFKVIVWDKVFALGVTDDLSASYWQLQMVIFGAYFLTRGFEKRR
jgi:hypothetical protein